METEVSNFYGAKPSSHRHIVTRAGGGDEMDGNNPYDCLAQRERARSGRKERKRIGDMAIRVSMRNPIIDFR